MFQFLVSRRFRLKETVACPLCTVLKKRPCFLSVMPNFGSAQQSVRRYPVGQEDGQQKGKPVLNETESFRRCISEVYVGGSHGHSRIEDYPGI